MPRNLDHTFSLPRLMILAGLMVMLSACSHREYVHVGQNWEILYNLPSGKGISVDVSMPADACRVGEEMVLTVTSDTTGRFFLLNVGPDDQVQMLFPNAMSDDNRISADKPRRLPPKGSEWKMVAAPPAGPQLVVALVIPNPDDDDISALESENPLRIQRLLTELSRYGMARKVFDIKK
jgi:hypothetical protein